ncbi:MAG: hypothetical protein IKX00_02660 [Bacilli bacterium]|nr:hypothetical protein [Bacilli bacterium]
MNITETNNLIFIDHTNISYLTDVILNVDEQEVDILNFFRLSELKTKWKVEVLPFEEFKTIMIEKRGRYEDYMSGCAFSEERTIRILNIEDQIKYTKHKDADFEKFCKQIVHEFVHACYAEILPNAVQWFNEALATFLSHQDRDFYDISDVDLTGLKVFNEIASKGGYSYSYFIACYLFNNYPEEEVFELAKDRDLLISKSNFLFDETKKWIKEQLNIRGKK